jgi:hypothetical protein
MRTRQAIVGLALVLLVVLLIVMLFPEPDIDPSRSGATPREPTVASREPVRAPVPAEPTPPLQAPETGPQDWRIDVTTLGLDGLVLVERFHAKFRKPGETRPSASVHTEKQSTFSLDVSGPGSLVISCSTASHPPLRFNDLTRPESGVMAIEARFTEGLFVSGELIDQDGVTPVAGRVRLGAKERGPWHGERPRSVKTEADGRFLIGGLCPGRYEVIADPRDRGAGRRPDPNPEVEAGGPPLRIVFRPVTRLRVRVVVVGDPPEKDGLTILAVVTGSGRTLSSTSWTGSPAVAKEYFVPLGEQTIEIQVTSEGYRRVGGGKIELSPDDREADVEVRMASETGLRATLVLRAKDSLGRPIASLRVLRRISPQVFTGKVHTAEGGFIEVALDPGKNRLVLSSPLDPTPLVGALLDQDLSVDLLPGERKVMDVEMALGGWIRILGFTGKWNALWAAPAGEKLKIAATRRAPDGRGRLLNRGAALASGRWVLEWRRNSGDAIRREVEVQPERVAEVKF